MNAQRRAGSAATAFAIVTLLAACAPGNQSPGNDREAAGARAEPPAGNVSPEAVLAGAAPDSVMPGSMNPQDMAALAMPGACRFRLTRVDFPAAVYGADGAVLKVDGRMLRLDAAGPGHFAAGGIDLRIEPLGGTGPASADGRATLVLRVQGARDERAYDGWSDCDRA